MLLCRGVRSGRSGVELGVREHRLDRHLAFAVELLAELGLRHAAHERVTDSAANGLYEQFGSFVEVKWTQSHQLPNAAAVLWSEL